MDIDVGLPAIDRPSSWPPGYTAVLKDNPANLTGTITKLELFVDTALTNCQVALFYETAPNTLTTRSTVDLGNVPIGYNAFVVDMAVEAGDFIGLYYSSGRLDRHDAGYAGIWYSGGDCIPCANRIFNTSGGRGLSLYATGAEPAPPPPPGPPGRFLVKDMKTHYDGPTKVVTVYTDIACHLYMRYQDTGIVHHPRIRVVRGVEFHRDPHLGFDNWVRIEQIEEGDTLEHTFVIPDFQPCETWYWQFESILEGLSSLSMSPVFHQHRPFPPDRPVSTHYFGFGAPDFSGTFEEGIMWGSRKQSTLDGWALRISFKITNLGGNWEAVKFALYTGEDHDQTLLACSEWATVPPLFDDYLLLELEPYPELVFDKLYHYLWFISAGTLQRHWSAGAFGAGSSLFKDYGPWLRTIDLGHNGYGAAATVFATIHNPYK